MPLKRRNKVGIGAIPIHAALSHIFRLSQVGNTHVKRLIRGAAK